MAVAAVLVAVLTGIVVVRLLDRGDGGAASGGEAPTVAELDRVGSVEAAGAEPVEPGGAAVPPAYEITYRLETFAAGDEVVATEVHRIERPFHSRVVLREGPPPGARVTGQRGTTFARLGIFANGQWTVLVTPPALAGSDLRPAAALPRALEEGMIERREVREVAGRRCQVYRAGGPVFTGALTPLGAAPAGEYGDFCVDEAGLLLEDLWVQDDRVLRRMVATEVEVAPEFPDGAFDMGRPEQLTFEEGGGSARPVDPESRPGLVTWEVPEGAATPLDGFEHIGRWAVVPPRLEIQIDPGDPNRRRTAGIVDLYARGVDVVFIDQGGSTQDEPPFSPHPHGREVELGQLDLGEWFLDLRTNEVRTAFTDGTFVRVYGTVPVDDLIAVARALEPREPGELVYLDD